MAKVCISGYYGFDEIDQELTLMSIVDSLRRQAEYMEITVFSGAPAKTESDFDVVAVDRNQWDQIHKELSSADLLIVGGGLLMKETSDLGDIKYYVKMIKMALRMKMPVFIFNQSFEPYTSSRAKKMVGGVMQKVRKITVADESSVEVLHEMGIRRGRIHVLESPVLNLTDVETEWNISEVSAEDKKVVAKEDKAAMVKEEKKPANYEGMEVEIEIRIVDKEESVPVEADKTIVIDHLAAVAEAPVEEAAPAETETKMAKPVANRPVNLGTIVPTFWKKPGEKFAAFAVSPKTELPVTQIAAMADYLVESGYQVVYVPVSYPEDIALGKEFLNMMKHPGYEVDAKLSPRSFYTALQEVDFVFTDELYPMMIAALCKKPFASLCCTEKDLDFVSALGLTPTGNMMEFNNEAFVHNFKAVVADPAAVLAAIEENLPALREKAAYAEDQIRMIFEQLERSKNRAASRRSVHSESKAELPVAVNAAEAVAEEPAEEIVEKVVSEEIVEEASVAEGTVDEVSAEEVVEEEIFEKDADAPIRRRNGKSEGGKGKIAGDILSVVKEKLNALIEFVKGLINNKGQSGKKRTRRTEAELPAEERMEEDVIPEEYAEEDVFEEEKEAR
ncbi:MAG: polysaccharide pyruvyl transferase family protein [Firmicutes bacterium]|nr:polysaccharide pyruvyl transferase family protein [Bacillota bacterium]